MRPIFEIKNLCCEYVAGQPVLSIDDLLIPRGKLIFVIGRSGIGKSTFIETLGLMNNTIAKHEDTSFKFIAEKSKEGIELKDCWSLDNTSISDFRRDHLSFIFQNTNLMPNFSAGENMMVSLLIKGVPKLQAKKEVLSVMKKLSLDEVIFDKKITELSGGQRQRLAFVRAITSDFSVLFGDEPTGNLDENTASDLIMVLKNLIHANNKTGIIVSHDLKLAVEYADVIVPITAKKTNETIKEGEIVPENIIHRHNGHWHKKNEDKIERPMDHLQKYLGLNGALINEDNTTTIRH